MTSSPLELHCANHPETATSLRCNNCEKPICAKCAVLTPTGYRCRECVRGQQKQFDTAQWIDYPLIFLVAGGLSFLGSWLVTIIGFFTILLAPAAGLVIAEASRRVVGRRRSKRLFQVAAIASGLGALPFVLSAVLSFILFRRISLDLLWLGLYLLLVPSTVYARLRGINIR
jgi:hypothetical protein